MSALFSELKQIEPDEQNKPCRLMAAQSLDIDVYPNSITVVDDAWLFVGRANDIKYLWIYSDSGKEGFSGRFEGEEIALPGGHGHLLCCEMSNINARQLREYFDWARPKLLGLEDSFGYGDRLGIANPAHVRAANSSRMTGIFAQQSIRELQRTQRTPDQVMDAATWAVLQEGYKDGFGADADHLKTPDDIDLMVAAGFTFFTIDPGEYVINDADTLSIDEVLPRVQALPWQALDDNLESCLGRYVEQEFAITDDFAIRPNREQVLRGLLKYGGVINHTAKMYRYLTGTYPDHPSEFELSVDETESVTSPFEHFLVAAELKRLGVKLVSLAPRFVGDFEKGIDYRGDIELFKQEYVKHVGIAEKMGPYKISLHSGSDKFDVYNAIGSLKLGHVHVKTAGTSYLEALKTVATVDPELFRKILDFSRGLYEQEKKTYHVSAQLSRVKAAADYSDQELVELFGQDDARQVLHVTFGKVLTQRDAHDQFLFKDQIMDCLTSNEETHYDLLYRHFWRHLQPFE